MITGDKKQDFNSSSLGGIYGSSCRSLKDSGMLRNLMLPLADVLGEPEDSRNLKLRNNQANTTDALFGGDWLKG